MHDIPTLQQIRAELEKERLHASERYNRANHRIELIEEAIAESAIETRRFGLNWIVASTLISIAVIAATVGFTFASQ